ncbi:subtilisin-like protein [Dacryopinax primogenitus]|uniref:tripeptidyl-peptidase II n=1 Tax=Dacryopinax primogenitus (strain DJM 731) TaxID=1858805 RepID=M5FSP2_DACPD|nr:subtilisin-like protein [Dacryopinax primogenitus]EJT98953.1 subtilisin-like protein [Dacryopinax primogenitus]
MALLLLLLLAIPALCAPQTLTPQHTTTPPQHWTPLSRAPPSHPLQLQIILHQPNISLLHSRLLAVSDPLHEEYGQHLTKSEVDDLAAPGEESVRAVEGWLRDAGLSHRAQRTRGGISLLLPVSEADPLLGAEYTLFQHLHTREGIARTLSYSLPPALHAHIRAIQPTTIFARPLAMHSPPRVRPLQVLANTLQTGDSDVTQPTCEPNVTPACLAQMYGTRGYTPAGDERLGITGYLGQNANLEDLQRFYQAFATDAQGSSFTTVLVNGGENNQTLSAAGTEANLDVQYSGALTFPLENIFYSTAGSPPFLPDPSEQENTNEPYAAWLEYMLGLEDQELPGVVSTSYGDDEQSVPEGYARAVCDQFAQLGARGVSLLFASGDAGVGPAENECYSNSDGRKMFVPDFPASCPWVTSVGATTGDPEIAASFSGGGFSNYFPRQEWQDSAVEAYLSTLNGSYAGMYNSSGRAYPDVSAQGQNYVVYVSGQPGLVDGTSCSTPTFASIILLLNDALQQQSKPRLGWLNPWLYGRGKAGVGDVSVGRNPGCGTAGFGAGRGWDPVTGLGTPRFGLLREVLGV